MSLFMLLHHHCASSNFLGNPGRSLLQDKTGMSVVIELRKHGASAIKHFSEWDDRHSLLFSCIAALSYDV